ncbi:MAG: WD40 repeat domain-containing protein [bacterium]|nr:WD40 repeat domain-containing protein [bacterium]
MSRASPACFAPDGAAVFTSSLDGTIREWDATTGAARRTWGPLGESVESVAVAPDGTWLVAGLNDGRVVILDRAAVAAPVVLHEGSGWASVAVSPDGRRIAAAHRDGFVRMWEATTRRLIGSWPAHADFAQVAWAPRGDRLVTGGGDGLVKVWEPASGRLLHTFNRHTRRVYCLAVSDDGRLVASGGMDQLAVVHDLQTGEHLTTFHAHSATVTGLTFMSGDRQVLSVAPDGRLLRWDVRTGAVLTELRGHRRDVNAVTASADGRLLASADWGGVLKIWAAEVADVAVFRVLSLPTLVVNVGCLAIDPAGRVVIGGNSQGGLPVWPLPGSSTLPTRVDGTEPATSLGFSPDGGRLLAGTTTGRLLVLDATAWTATDTLTAHRGEVNGLAVHPTGRWVATGGDDAVVMVRELGADGLLARTPRVLGRCGGALKDLVFTRRRPAGRRRCRQRRVPVGLATRTASTKADGTHGSGAGRVPGSDRPAAGVVRGRWHSPVVVAAGRKTSGLAGPGPRARRRRPGAATARDWPSAASTALSVSSMPVRCANGGAAGARGPGDGAGIRARRRVPGLELT